MSEREFVGVARLIGSVPNTVSRFAVGEIELYELDPPLCGYRVVAASKSSGPCVSLPHRSRRRIRSRQRSTG